MPNVDSQSARRVVFQYFVSVHVEVDSGRVTSVIVIDETAISAPTLVEGDAVDPSAAVAAADNGQCWPSWQFGY